MKKKSLVFVVALLALSGLMAAMAYTSASVKNSSQIVINNTNNALLAIASAGSFRHNDGTVQIVDGEAVFNFGRGKGGQMFGFQPNSVYKYEFFMHVMNNTDNTVEAEIVLEDFGPYAQFITIKGAPGPVLVENGVTTENKILLNSTRDHWNLGLIITIPSAEELEQLGVNVSSIPFEFGTVVVNSWTIE